MSAPHGSPAGHRAGCRTAGMCPNHDDAALLTCAEAAARRRADYRASRLPEDEPLARERPRRDVPTTGVPHGTWEGFLLGCRDARLCPGGPDADSCASARAHRRADYAHAAGIAPRAEPLDAEDAAERVRAWMARGHTLREIAAATGCGFSTIGELAREGRDRRRRVSPRTMRRILGADGL